MTAHRVQKLERAVTELAETLEEARLIVANLPHDESLFLSKIDAALKAARLATGQWPT